MWGSLAASCVSRSLSWNDLRWQTCVHSAAAAGHADDNGLEYAKAGGLTKRAVSDEAGPRWGVSGGRAIVVDGDSMEGRCESGWRE